MDRVMGMVMTIITARTTMEVFMGRTFSYLGTMIMAISTTILDIEGSRAGAQGADFTGGADTQKADLVMEEADFTEVAVVADMEGAAGMGDNSPTAEIL